MKTMDGAVGVYFEAAAVITALALLGQVLELRAREQTSGALRALLDLTPKTARRINSDGGDEEVRVDLIAVGDRLRVRPGEKMPVDGVVLEGRSAVDESMVTGESMPVREAGAKLIAGTINRSGALVMEAKRVGRHTMLSQIVQMVASRTTLTRADPKAGRPGVGLVCPAVIAVAARPSSSGPGSVRSPVLPTASSRRSRSSSSPAHVRWGSRHRCRSWSGSGRAPASACSSRMPRRSSASKRSTRWLSTRQER